MSILNLPAKPKVLIVDDDPGMINALYRLLRKQPIQITTTTSPHEALQLLEKELYAIVLSDQCMPGMTGNELFEKASAICPNTVRLLLTGNADMQAALEAINKGSVFRFITKPWDDAALQQTILDALEQFNLVMENKRLLALTVQQNQELKVLNTSLEEKVEERAGEIQRLSEDLEKSLMGTVRVLASLSEMQRISLGSHAKRVAGICKTFGQFLGMQPEAILQLEVAALLHDIGKMGFSTDMLNKPMDQLQAQEKKLLWQHPARSEAVLRSIPNFEEAALIARHHHEKYDGQGFPDALRGEAIPYGARILGLVDAYDKILHRPESLHTMTPIDAIRELIDGASYGFDPALMARFEQFITFGGDEQYDQTEIEIYPNDLQSGMILSRDIVTLRGILILPKGTQVHPTHIEKVCKLLEADPAAEGIFIQRSMIRKPLQRASSAA